MRFHCPRKPPVDREQWHRWYAWHPVRIGDEIVWCEQVARKGNYESPCYGDSGDGYWVWEYDWRENHFQPVYGIRGDGSYITQDPFAPPKESK